MKIQQVHIRNFRNFSAESQPIRFADETTGKTRELTVIAGSNGCGKTTILETLFELVQTIIDIPIPTDFCKHLVAKSYASIDIDLTNSTLWKVYFESEKNNAISQKIRMFIGNKKWGAAGQDLFIGMTDDKTNSGVPFDSNIPGLFENLALKKLNNYLGSDNSNLINKDSGLIFFPHDRWQYFDQTARVEEPPKSTDWCYRWVPTSRKSKSLAQFWVWQNYLDLEQSREGRTNLAPFVEIIETILGP